MKFNASGFALAKEVTRKDPKFGTLKKITVYENKYYRIVFHVNYKPRVRENEEAVYMFVQMECKARSQDRTTVEYYLPFIYCNGEGPDDGDWTKPVSMNIQTTSYGALAPMEFGAFLDAMHLAQDTAQVMKKEIFDIITADSSPAGFDKLGLLPHAEDVEEEDD